MTARQKTTHTFTVDIASEEDDRRYSGSFTVRRLSVRDQGKLQVRKVQLNGGSHYVPESPGVGVPREVDTFHYMLAHLEISVVSAPPWWDLDAITDISVVQAVFQEVISFEESFLGRNRREADGGDAGRGREGNSAEKAPEANPVGGAGTVVVGQVQAALEP